MVSALDSGSSGPGSSPGRGHSVVFWHDTTLAVPVHPGVGRQRGRVVRASDLKTVGRGFKSRSDH